MKCESRMIRAYKLWWTTCVQMLRCLHPLWFSLTLGLSFSWLFIFLCHPALCSCSYRISLRLLSILRDISINHYALRPEVFNILKACLGLNPRIVNSAANLRIKKCLVHCIADLIWHTHPAKAPGAHDGVDLDVLKLMSDIASKKAGTPVQETSSLSAEDIVLEFTKVLFQVIRPPYSPAFSRALGLFLTAGGENGLMRNKVLRKLRGGHLPPQLRAVKEGIRQFGNSGYRRFMRKEDHLTFQCILDEMF